MVFKFFAILTQRHKMRKLESDAIWSGQYRREISGGIAGWTFGAGFARAKKKKGEIKILRFGRASRICCVSDKSRSGNLQIAKRTGIRIHVDDDGNVNTYTRNDVATHVPSVTHLRGSRPHALRDARRLRGTASIRTYAKMRIHFLQNVSHSAAHYRRNEKGMMHRGNSDKEDTSETTERGREREEDKGGVGEREKRGEEDEGTVERGRGKGRAGGTRRTEGKRQAWTFRETRKNATPPRHDRSIFVFTKLCIPRASAISLKA